MRCLFKCVCVSCIYGLLCGVVWCVHVWGVVSCVLFILVCLCVLFVIDGVVLYGSFVGGLFVLVCANVCVCFVLRCLWMLCLIYRVILYGLLYFCMLPFRHVFVRACCVTIVFFVCVAFRLYFLV